MKEVEVKIPFSSNGKVVMGELEVSAKKLEGAIAAASKGINKQYKAMTESMASTVVAIQGVTYAFQQLAEPAMSFDEAMRAANTMAGKSGEGLEKLTGQIKGLSKEIPVARDLLAEGLYQTISNGVPEDNWISFLETSARSSVGGMANLNEVVKVTSTIIKNYGYSWEEAGAIQDKIQLTAKNGVTSFEQLAQALPKVTGNAATLGVQINELMATFSTLTGVSGNTAEVATQLGAIFTALVKPSREAQKMAAAMGIEFDDAAIKAAGGLENFLTSLDKAVKEYAQANGVLEQAIYGKLFGSAEALRAIGPLVGQLSDKFSENIEGMADSAGTMDEAFATMSRSVSSAIQLMKNGMADAMDSIGQFAASWLPVLQQTANLTIALNGVKAVITVTSSVIKSFDAVIKASAIGLKYHNSIINASGRAFYSLPKPISGAIAKIVGFGSASKGASLAIRGLSIAIKGIISATVIGAVFVAATTAMEYFSGKSEEVTDALKDLEDGTNAYTQSAADAKVQIDADIKSLGELIKSKGDTKEAVDKLNSSYGETFGTFKTAEEWYKVLTENSQLYIKQIGYEAQARALAAEMAKVSIEKELAAERKAELERSGKHKQIVSRIVGSGSSGYTQTITAEVETKDYIQAKKDIEAAAAAEAEFQKRLDVVAKKVGEVTSQIKSEMSQESSTTPTNNLNDLIKGDSSGKDKTYKQQLEKQLADAKEKYVQAAIKGNKEEAESMLPVIAGLNAQIAEVEKIEKEMEQPKTLTTLSDINKAIQYQRALRENASKEYIAQIDEEIERLQKLYKELDESSKKIKPVGEIETDEELDAALNYYTTKLRTANEEERAEIQRTILEYEKLKEAREEALGELSAPGDISTLKSGRDFDNALSYYQNKQNKAKTDQEYADYQRKINEINKAKSSRENISTIIGYQDEIADLKGLSDKDLKMKLQLIGADGIASKIQQLKAMMIDPNIPDEFKQILSETIGQWEQYRKVASDSTAVAAQGISMVGQAFTNLGGIFDETTGKWMNYVGSMLESISKLIPALMAVTSANSANSAAQTPVIGWLQVPAAIAATVAAFANIPKFADGGIAYGPTMGLFGEYAGASNNPEVVAPLDKLRSMIQPQGEMAGRVEFEIDGRKLKGVLKKVDALNSRS